MHFIRECESALVEWAPARLVVDGERAARVLECVLCGNDYDRGKKKKKKREKHESVFFFFSLSFL